jgi:hypothetical protein
MSHEPGIPSAKVNESGPASSSVPTMISVGWVIFERALQVSVQVSAESNYCGCIWGGTVSFANVASLDTVTLKKPLFVLGKASFKYKNN